MAYPVLQACTHGIKWHSSKPNIQRFNNDEAVVNGSTWCGVSTQETHYYNEMDIPEWKGVG
jgi:hypothetical protein